ncbi:MAG: hypothetical protein LBM04_07305, partial [Opitutaceae bacterium]|nr:hypothetical protein [Opitutaceae bacterium]
QRRFAPVSFLVCEPASGLTFGHWDCQATHGIVEGFFAKLVPEDEAWRQFERQTGSFWVNMAWCFFAG